MAGRRHEQEVIEGFLRGLPGDGTGALLIGGEAGIGKTTLWRFATDRARDLGAQVLVSRPAEEEMPMSGVGLVDLFEHVDLELEHSVLDDPFTTGRTVLEAFRALLERGAVVIAIDDLQWLDSVSARALRYSLRRFRTEPVAIVATVRGAAAPPDPLSLAITVAPDRITLVEPGPLDLEDVRRVITGTVTTISRPVLRRIHEVSGGNPMYAIELARGVEATGRLDLSPGQNLADPLRTAVGERIATVPDEMRSLLDTISVLGRTRIDRLRAAMVPRDADLLIAAAEREGLVILDEDFTVRLSHPVIGSVVYSMIDPIARRDLHARVADLATDPDDRARHLALSSEPPDPPVARLLEEAADRANRRGAPDLAAEFARHSLQLTPIGDDADVRRREIGEITYLSLAGEASRALAAADRLVDTLPHGPDRAAMLIQRFEVEDDDLDLGDELLSGALEDAGEDELLRGRVLDMLAWLRGVYRGDLADGIRCAREGVAIAERIGDPHLRMVTQSSLALLAALVGEPHPDRLADAVSLERRSGVAVPSEGPLAISGKLRFWAGDLPAARRYFEEALTEAARSGNELTRPYRLYDLSLLACAEGDLPTALELVTVGIEAAEDAAFPPGSLQYPLALVQSWLGDADAARTTVGVLTRLGRASR
ncbi:MAG: AAA family ATPase [Actinomycetota bacterium]